jgi:hypothetical protein
MQLLKLINQGPGFLVREDLCDESLSVRLRPKRVWSDQL